MANRSLAVLVLLVLGLGGVQGGCSSGPDDEPSEALGTTTQAFRTSNFAADADETLTYSGGAAAGTSRRNGGSATICAGQSRGAWVHFNVSSIPSGATITKATLTLTSYQNCTVATETPQLRACADPMAMDVYAATSSITETTQAVVGPNGGPCGGSGTVPGTAPALTVSATGASPLTGVGSTGTITFSSTAMRDQVRNWRSNAANNFGWVVGGSGGMRLMRSRTASSGQPNLAVEYTLGAGTLCSVNADCTSGVCNVRCCSGACGACKDCDASGGCTIDVPRFTDDPACGPNETCNGSGQCRDDNGQSCTGTGSSCASGMCRDLRCCSTDCNGTCESCANSSGSCTAFGNGTDPANECQHTCNGSSGCGNSCAVDTDCGSGFYCNGTNCVSQAGGGEPCTTTNQCGTGLVCSADNVCCDALCSGDCQSCLSTQNGGLGDGTCGPSPQFSDPANDCFPGSCSGAASCGTSCTDDTQCDAGAWCNAGTCTAKFGNGTACSEVRQCQTGLCVDGVCCNAACGGQCEACDNAGNVGSCVATNGSPHGARTQCAGDGSACNGTCDGVTRASCALPGGSVQCRAASCSAGQAQLPASCVGTGSCPALATQDCAPYQCGGTACLTSCSLNTQCQLGFRCDAGVCVPARPNGDACSAGAECASGFCIDGFCCDTACNGQCEACNLAASEGTCSAALGAPVGGRPSCADDGSACGGSCNGVARSACAYPSSSVSCRAASCDAGNAILAAGCNGAGACPAQQNLSCPTGACSGVVCDGDCVANADCGVDEYCAAGTCQPTRSQGQPCGSAAECASGRCVDGFCCNAACSGQCEACNVTGSQGTCSPVSGAPRGARPACASDGSVCAGTCDGIATSACAYPGAAAVCRAAACSAGIATVEARCAGTGACSNLQQQTCTPYACHASLPLCDGDCTQDSDCTSPQYCLAGICSNPQGNGSACSSAAQCGSGNCIDGVCCNEACSGQCQSCSEPGFVGTCSLVSGSPRGGRAACTGTGLCAGSCDGSGTGCGFPGGETVCGVGSCSADVSIPDAACNGAGECLSQNAVSCFPYHCAAGGGCQSSCVTVDDCAAGFECVSGACEQPVSSGGAGGGAGVGGAGGVTAGGSAGVGGAVAAGAGGTGGSLSVPDAGVVGGSAGAGNGLIPATDEGSTCSLGSAPRGRGGPAMVGLSVVALAWLNRRRRRLGVRVAR